MHSPSLRRGQCLAPAILTVALASAQAPIAEVTDSYRVTAALGDLDGDGHADLVLGRNGSFVVRTGTARAGDPRFAAERPLGIAVLPSCKNAGQPQLLDFDGDGDLDLLALDSPMSGEERLVWFANNGNGTFAAAATVRAANGAALRWSSQAHAAVVADVDGDGRRDVLVATPRVQCFAGGAAGLSADGRELGIASQGAIALADLRGSGRPDLVAVVDGVVVAYVRDGAGWGQPRRLLAIEGDAGQSRLGVGDWNGDGTVDLLVGETRALLAKPPPARTDDEKARLTAAREVLAVVHAERRRLDQSKPPLGDDDAMARRQAWRSELDRWAAGPQAVVAAFGDTVPGTSYASRVRLVLGVR